MKINEDLLIGDENISLKEIQSEITELQGTITTTSDGYTKIVYPKYTEYFKRGNFIVSMSGNTWTHTIQAIALPSDVKGNTTNRFVTGAVRSSDGAVMVGWNDDASNFLISGNNTYSGSVQPTIYYTIRVIKFTT